MIGNNNKYILALFLLGFNYKFSLCQRSINPEIQRKIDDYIKNEFLPAFGVSGMGLTILQNDTEILYTTGYGLANKEKGIENRNITQSMLGSVSKSFTALLAAKILHETFPEMGEAVLDTPIRKLLPQLNFTLSDRFRSEHASFRDLLAHRVCLSEADVAYEALPFNSTEQFVYRTRYTEEICGFRSQFQYSNDMYMLAGEFAAVLANKSFTDAVMQIFTPMQDFLNDLGMVNTTLLKETDDFSQMSHRAMPYYIKDDQLYPMNAELIKRELSVLPAGGIFSTPNDMTRYMRLHLNMGSLDGRQIVPREVMEWIHKPSNLRSSPQFKKSDRDKILNQFGYALGLHLGSYDGWELISHGGYYPPYLSQMSLYPGKNLGIFSSTHMGPTNLSMDVLHAFIFELLTENPTPEESANKLAKQLNEKPAGNNENGDKKKLEKFYRKVPLTENANIMGQYGSGSLGELEVVEKFNNVTNNTEYFLKYGIWFRGNLVEINPNFVYKLNFTTDAVQMLYADGAVDWNYYLGFDNGTLTMYVSEGDPDSDYILGTFQLGLKIDLLPGVPWDPKSCGN